MKKSTVWAVIVVVAVIVAMGALIVLTQHSASDTNKNDTSAAPIITYLCDDQRIIAAQFGSDDVTIAFSDGRSFVLSKIAAASGTRYEKGSGTSQDFAFINNDTSASFTENGSTTYSNCVLKTVAASSTPATTTASTSVSASASTSSN